MNFIHIIILSFLMQLLSFQHSVAQTKYNWLNMTDTIRSDKQLFSFMQMRFKKAIKLGRIVSISQIEKEISDCVKNNDSLRIASGYYLLASIEDYYGNYIKSIKLFEKSALWLKNTNHTRFISVVYSKTGYALSRISRYDSALVYYSKSLKVRENILDTLGVVNVKNFIGNVYKQKGEYKKAFNLYVEALSLIPDTSLFEARAFTLINIGSVFIEVGNLNIVEKYYRNALKIREQLNDDFLIAHTYNKLAQLYFVKGDIDLSIEYCLKSISIFDNKKWEKPLPIIYNTLGLCYLSKNEFNVASDFFSLSRKIAIKENNKIQLAKNDINLGKLYLQTEKYKTSIKYLLSAIKIGEEIESKMIIADANYILADAYFYDKQYKLAFISQKKYSKLKNSRFSSGFAESIASFISSQELEKANLIFEIKQNERKLIEKARIKQERLLKNIYLILSFVFLVLVFVLYRGIRLKVKTNRKLAESNLKIVEKRKKILTQRNNLLKQKEELNSTLRDLQVLKKAIEQSSSTVVITNSRGVIEYTNPKFSETTGYSEEEAIGKNPRILKSGNKPSSFYKEMWDTLLNGNEWHGEFENVKKSGEKYFESASIASIRDENGKITHFIAVKEDVTERKKMIQELEKLNSIQTKLFSVIGHDLRSPLGAIQSILEIVSERDDVLDNVELYKMLSIVLKSVVSVAFLSENLLNWANSWQATHMAHAISFNLAEKVQENIALLSSIAYEKILILN